MFRAAPPICWAAALLESHTLSPTASINSPPHASGTTSAVPLSAPVATVPIPAPAPAVTVVKALATGASARSAPFLIPCARGSFRIISPGLAVIPGPLPPLRRPGIINLEGSAAFIILAASSWSVLSVLTPPRRILVVLTPMFLAISLSDLLCSSVALPVSAIFLTSLSCLSSATYILPGLIPARANLSIMSLCLASSAWCASMSAVCLFVAFTASTSASALAVPAAVI